MKKFFTLLAVCMAAIAANATIKIYVQSTIKPYIWCWGIAAGQTDPQAGREWPDLMPFNDAQENVDGEDFWVYSFPEDVTYVSFLLANVQDGAVVAQTGDIKDITSDHYFTWDGASTFTDITENYVEVPDAVVESVLLKGNNNNWGNDIEEGVPAEVINFEVVEAGKTFKLTVDPKNLNVEEGLWEWKFVPNGTTWVGYWDLYYYDPANPVDENDVAKPEEGKVSQKEAPVFLGEGGGNFKIDLEKYEATSFTFTVTWGGGKKAGENWTIAAEAENLVIHEDTEGISTVKALNSNNAAIFNLQGQRVNNSFRGIAIQNGKKFMVK